MDFSRRRRNHRSVAALPGLPGVWAGRSCGRAGAACGIVRQRGAALAQRLRTLGDPIGVPYLDCRWILGRPNARRTMANGDVEATWSDRRVSLILLFTNNTCRTIVAVVFR